jgi:hypothetical protein
LKYSYVENKLIDEKGNAVMMDWEKPIMKLVSEMICKNGGRILNIGFGMGIVDTYISELQPMEHVIIERNLDVYKYMVDNGWLEKPNTKVIFDSWQNVLDDIGIFDGIYLDTWCDERLQSTPKLLEKNLKVGGVFSMWYNQSEFSEILQKLDDKYSVSFIQLRNDELIPYSQHQNGKFYIEPYLENITIPQIIKNFQLGC